MVIMTTAPHVPEARRELQQESARPAGLASIVAGVGAVAVAWLENHRSSIGFNDADDPRVMLAFFREHREMYTSTGVLWMVIGVAVTAAVIGLWRSALAARPGIVVSVGSVFGLISGAFFFAQGVLRIQTPGTVLHIAGLDKGNGEAAYAAVQMAGTQGFGSAGGFALAIWASAVALGTLRSRALPRPVAVLAVLPALFLLMGVLGGLFGPLEELYLLYLAAVVVGLPLWCVGLGIALLLLKPRRQVPDPLDG